MSCRVRGSHRLELLEGTEGQKYVYIEELDEVWTIGEWETRGPHLAAIVERRKNNGWWWDSDKAWWVDLRAMALELVEMTWEEDRAKLDKLYGIPQPPQDVVSFELEADE